MSLTYDQHVASFRSLRRKLLRSEAEMSAYRERIREGGPSRFTAAEQFAEYGLAQCCACRRILVERHLGPPDPQGHRRCANWSDCREARAMAEVYQAQHEDMTAWESAEPDGQREKVNRSLIEL
jgi:hypothetical protein